MQLMKVYEKISINSIPNDGYDLVKYNNEC